MSSGKYFSMEDGEQKRVKKMNQSLKRDLKNQFMDKAKQFMDDTSLGEFKDLKDGKALLNKILGKEDTPSEELSEDVSEDWEDEEWEEYDDEEEFDMTEPEKIRVGYMKPGSAPPPPKKTVEEARDESFDLKLGNLSGLLTRFGAEGTEEFEEETSAQARQLDKPLFKGYMQALYQKMSIQAGESEGLQWLEPDILSLLATQNSPQKLLDFVTAGIFCSTPENFLAESDQRRIVVLLKQIGSPLSDEQIEGALEQLFLFTERVFRLYQTLREEPPQVVQSVFQQHKQNLAKFYIHQLAEKYAVSYQSLISHFQGLWQEGEAQLKVDFDAQESMRGQYQRLKDRKVSSGTIFHKLVTLEQAALRAWHYLSYLAQDIYKLREVTRLIGETEALERLAIFPLGLFLDDSPVSMPLSELTDLFRTKQSSSEKKNSEIGPIQEGVEAQTSALSPLNQKKAITQAKLGDLNSLKVVASYKRGTIAALKKGLLN